MAFLKELIKNILGKNKIKKTVKYLKAHGAHIGEHVNFYGDVNIDKGFPFMLHIGNHVEITDKVTILCHDYSWSVIKRLNGHLLGGGRKCVYI